MFTRIKCPDCGVVAEFPDSNAGRVVHCPVCGGAIGVPSRSARRREPAGGERAEGEPLPTLVPALRPHGDFLPRPVARVGTRADRHRGWVLPLCLGGVGITVYLGLNIAAVVWWYSRGGPPSAPEAAAARPEAPPAEARAGEPAAGNAEEFIDLPERNEGLPVVLDLPAEAPPGNPLAAPNPGKTRVVLFNGEATRVRGNTGVLFQVNYRFEQGEPGPGVRYAWIIQTARRRSFRQLLTLADLRRQGTLSGRAVGAVWLDAPYQTYLAVEKLVPGRGWEEERISDTLIIR